MSGHNRKEGALALLAVFGGGAFLTFQQFIAALAERDGFLMEGMGYTAALCLTGGGFAYWALRRAEGDHKFFYVLEFTALATLALCAGLLVYAGATMGAISGKPPLKYPAIESAAEHDAVKE